MNEITTQSNTEIAMLGTLAQEAQFYAKGIVTNMIQLGRVLIDAKPLVKHGEWENWIAENAGCSPRYAQMFMQSYERFGDNPAIAQIKERGKVFKLLALPAGSEDQFLADNDVKDMTCREVEEAVRQTREEMDGKVAKEKTARKNAEARIAELEANADSVPDHVLDDLASKQSTIDQQRQEIDRIAASGRDAFLEVQNLRKEKANLQREVAEQNELIEDAQEQYNRMRSDLLAAQSTAAKGDAERVPVDELTIDVFASAVRQFVGTCARMPHMAHTFGSMLLSEKNAYDELLRTVEGWADGARMAMNTIYEEVEIRE